MAASDEWEIQYLTESGWVIGGYKLDCGDQKNDAQPEGAVMWVRRHVIVGKLGAPSSMRVNDSRSNLIQDVETINALLLKYGEPQFGV
ncbi:translation initiation factor 1 [Aeromonas bivalvium]|uniref:translation initiation factor 1 n=1 Tax=Aeromonas bivalvium TaxID=440079 RepID=UPI0012F92B70|nr:translation initiation factor 1 [Aeromonas bivalvium]